MPNSKITDLWIESTIISIPKPDLDHSNLTNYKPITLTIRVCKTVERMFNTRLMWSLE